MSEGINKVVSAKKEASWGAKASSSSAKQYPRVTSSFQLAKEVYQSSAINTSQQVKDMRHGSRSANGTINGELSGGVYTDFIQSAVRRDFTSGATTGTLTNLSVTESAGVSKFVRASGSFLTDGFKVGDVVQSAGFATSANNGLFVVVAVVALQLTVEHFDEGGVLVAESAGASASIVTKGKTTFAPLTGHTDDSYTVEEWFSDASVSRIFTGQVVDTLDITVAPNSMVTLDIGFMGKNGEPSGSSQYFTSPTAPSDNGTYSGVDGVLLINGVASRKVTSLSINISNGTTMEPVIGSNSQGAKSRTKIAVTGSLSALFDDATVLDYFDDETEISLSYAMRTADGVHAFGVSMDRVKLSSSNVDDGEKVLVLSADFQALEYTGAVTGGQSNTTIKLQDTTL